MPPPGVILLASSPLDLRVAEGPEREPFLGRGPPLGIYRIKKYLEDRELATCLVVDPIVDDHFQDRVLRFAREHRVLVVGVNLTRMYSATDLPNVQAARDWVASTQPAPLALAGGYECTLAPDEVLSFGYVDGVVRGFGELALGFLLRALRQPGLRENPRAIMEQEVPGLRWRDRNHFGDETTFPGAPFDPDELYRGEAQPLPVIPWERYWGGLGADGQPRDDDDVSRIARLVTSSHCLASCGFCSSRRYGTFVLGNLGQAPRVLMTPAEDVVELVCACFLRHGAQQIYFVDDDFMVGGPAGYERFREFATRMEEVYRSGRLPRTSGLAMQTKSWHFTDHRGLADWAGGSQASLEWLKRAGFLRVDLGVESLSDDLLTSPFINKKIPAEVQARVVTDCLDAGLAVSICYIPFPPDVTAESFRESLTRLIPLLRRGALLAVSPAIYVNAGSAAEKEIATGEWKVVSKPIPRADGALHPVPMKLLPSDPEMAHAFQVSWERNLERLQSLRQKKGVELALLADAADLAGSSDLAAELRSL